MNFGDGIPQRGGARRQMQKSLTVGTFHIPHN
jgi:hypothetical protein